MIVVDWRRVRTGRRPGGRPDLDVRGRDRRHHIPRHPASYRGLRAIFRYGL